MVLGERLCCLRWNNHHQSLSWQFVSLLERGELVDVSILVQGTILRAHRMLLSGSSPYFKEILTGLPVDQQAVFVLKDIPLRDMQNILEYIYTGEVTIPDQEMESFLASAASLQIKGLSEEEEDPGEEENSQDNPSLNSLNPDTQSDICQRKPSNPWVQNDLATHHPSSHHSSEQKALDPSPSGAGMKEEHVDNDKGEERRMAGDSVNRIESCQWRLPEHPAAPLYRACAFAPYLAENSAENYRLLLARAAAVSSSGAATGTVAMPPIGLTYSGASSKPSQELDDRRRRCPCCGIVLLRKNLARHLRDQHLAINQPRQICPLCYRSYKTSDWLKDHIRRGHGYDKETTERILRSGQLAACSTAAVDSASSGQLAACSTAAADSASSGQLAACSTAAADSARSGQLAACSAAAADSALASG